VRWDSCRQRNGSKRIALDLPADGRTLNPVAIHMDGNGMVKMKMSSTELKPKNTDSEKITINLGPIDLGQIDLLVSEGFYANRTDLIRTAIRNQLNLHADVVRQTVARKSLVLGMHHY
jgi:hypothetical protein